MLVRLLADLSGPTYLRVAGEECDFPPGEATRLIASGAAVPVAVRAGERADAIAVPERRDPVRSRNGKKNR